MNIKEFNYRDNILKELGFWCHYIGSNKKVYNLAGVEDVIPNIDILWFDKEDGDGYSYHCTCILYKDGAILFQVGKTRIDKYSSEHITVNFEKLFDLLSEEKKLIAAFNIDWLTKEFKYG